MKFYSISMKKPVEVPESEVEYRMTKNGRRQAMARDPMGKMMYKFVKK